jgi:hypothetical protein
VSKILFESPHHTPARAGAVVATIEVSPPTQSKAKLSPPIVGVVPPLSGTLPKKNVTTGASNENSAIVPTMPLTVSDVAVPLQDAQPRRTEVAEVQAEVEHPPALVVPPVGELSAVLKFSPETVTDGPPHRGAFCSPADTAGAAGERGHITVGTQSTRAEKRKRAHRRR